MEVLRKLIRYGLRVHLVGKLIGANAIIIAAVILVHALAFNSRSTSDIVITFAALAAATVVNLFLVRLALSPVNELERVAERVSSGDFSARSEKSPFADKDLNRLGQTVNSLLDALAVERKRIQDLGAEVVRAEDVERAQISRELHDSTAQTLAAVRFQLAAACADELPDELRNRIAAASTLVSSAMKELMSVSYFLHSRVASELGLEAALETLAQQVIDRSGAEVDVTISVNAASVAPADAVTLVRIAEETLRDIGPEPTMRSASINVSSGPGRVRIEIERDGVPGAFDGRVRIMGSLAAIKDRVLLGGGTMRIDTQLKGKIRVSAELNSLRAAS